MNKQSQVDRGECPHLSSLIPDLWDLLSVNEQEQLLIWSSFFIFKKGEEILRVGSAPRNVFILASGQVIISKDGLGDRTQIIRLVKPVEIFGYHDYFNNSPYMSNAIAVDTSVVCMVPIHILENIIEMNSKVAYFFLRDLAHKLSIADTRTVSLTQKHTRGRLAESLIMLKDKYGLEQDGATISIYLSRQEIANLSNMTTSNAIRTLYAFEEERILVLDGRKIKIMDEDRLLEVSTMG